MLMSRDEREEMKDAYVQRFRLGEIGPVTFRAMMTKLGIDAFEVERLKKLHEQENAIAFPLQHNL
jgi:hypothetical protein